MEHAESSKKPNYWNFATWGVGVLLVLIVILAVVQQVTSSAAKLVNITDLLDYFADAGFRIGESTPLDETAGAAQASRVAISDGDVGIYKFDTSDAEQAKLLEQISSRRAIDVGGRAAPAEVNQSFVMTGLERHPRGEFLRKAFLSFRSEDAAQRPIGERSIDASGTR